MRINPNAISAYQTQSVRTTGSAKEVGGANDARPNETVAKTTKLNGAKFLDLLSKSERKFLAENFRAESIGRGRKSGDMSHNIRGRLLDVKA